MKKLSFFLTMILVVGLLAGCAGTPVVYYTNCTCPVSEQTPAPTVGTPVVAEGAVKTGLAILTDLADSTSAQERPEQDTEEALEVSGSGAYDVTIVAVNVDENGMITDCVIDSLGTSVIFDENGVITSDLAAEIQTKNEKGEAYGMKANAGSKYEWYEQAAALANYAVGKTVEELKSGAVNESGYAADADLAATATIHIGGYVSGIEAAVANAQHLGAQADDELRLAVTADAGDSKNADGENAGLAQLNVDAVALNVNGETITACYLDSVQAKVSFDAAGQITSDLTAPVRTKNEQGEDYGMKAYAGAQYEWNEQAANFASYVTGKTAAEVAGIAVSEGKPADADLAATVTIKIGGFQTLIAKACQ